MKSSPRRLWLHPILLFFWMFVGTLLRFTHLASKPLWSDEFSTIVFSLGHSFRTVALNQVLTDKALLQPLQTASFGTVNDVIHRLMTESNHPPFYFVLNHWWMQLFSSDGLASPSLARSLSAFFGVLSIPAIFGLGWLIFHSLVISQLAAALMAVSPFGVYIAQEARHYTLAVLWGIASFACLTIALRKIQRREPLPIRVAIIWILVNSLGVATHYFFGLTLISEAVVLLGFYLPEFHRLLERLKVKSTAKSKALLSEQKDSAFQKEDLLDNPAWKQVYVAVVGTIVSCLVWLPTLKGSNSELTRWVFESYRSGLGWLNPLRYTLTSIVNTLVLLPVRQVDGSVIAAFVVAALGFSIWIWLIVGRGIQVMKTPQQRWMLWGLAGTIAAGAAVLCVLDYGLGTRLTDTLRYSFIYFPPSVLLLAVGLAPIWQKQVHPIPLLKSRGRLAIVLILLVGLVNGFAVSANWGYQKLHRSDLVAHDIEEISQVPTIVGIAHRSHAETGRLMGIALELKPSNIPRSFYLDHQTCRIGVDPSCNLPTPNFQKTLAEYPRPFDVWLLEFTGVADLTGQKCFLDSKLGTKRIPGYNYQHYHCPRS